MEINEPIKQEKPKNDKLINVSKKTFISVIIFLFALIALSIILTYIIPKGQFAIGEDGNPNYQEYVENTEVKGVSIVKGIFAPILLLGSSDGLSMIMLILFLIIITGVFQVMNDVKGIKAIVNYLIDKFKNREHLFFFVIIFVFMSFGAFLGLFEEVLTLLPIVIIIAISLGYDSFTGFLISLVATGIGFATSISNPFTVLLASQIIGVSPLANGWYRVIIFIVMYLLLVGLVLLYVKRIKKNPEKSYTYEHDLETKDGILEEEKIENEKFIRTVYTIFFILVFSVLLIFSLISSIRGYIVPGLIVVFLVFGLIAGYITSKNFKFMMKSFGKGVVTGLPSIALVLLASSIKYILVEGMVLDTIANWINVSIQGKSLYLVAILILLVVLVLEFFITSSTAKAVLVMGILASINIGLSKELLVLIYTFGDGYTNLFFPTSPVLLIGLSLIGFDYFKWVKKSWMYFLLVFLLVIGFICLGILIKY